MRRNEQEIEREKDDQDSRKPTRSPERTGGAQPDVSGCVCIGAALENREGRTMNPEYECPNCGEWIQILPTTPERFDCPWCKTPLLKSVDAEFRDGSWHDASHLSRVDSTMAERYPKDEQRICGDRDP